MEKYISVSAGPWAAFHNEIKLYINMVLQIYYLNWRQSWNVETWSSTQEHVPQSENSNP